MAQLQYLRTFIQISEEAPRAPRSRSADSVQKEDDLLDLYMDHLAERTATTYCWKSFEELVGTKPHMSSGSLGHPEVCSRPCVRFSYGTCAEGADCKFCHLQHDRPKGKLDKTQRKYFDTLDASQVLVLLLPYIKMRCAKKGLTTQMSQILEALEEHYEPAVVPLRVTSVMSNALNRLTLARLLELLIHSRQVSPALQQRVEALLREALGRRLP
ncbi:unnamed protein product [Effrenium voratum]|nr:unnamed protein product [Effrenium voratum]|mmetsp:Transcript_99832/g.237941  ORF Transcript_99832/g.237941 Transcript_99832/m.237941 type:complete len:214 (-) Transcript_99832:58-699(-)